MEENNGRINEVNPTMEELQKENTALKQYLQSASERINNLSNGWIAQRINWLFEIVKLEGFSTELKVRAIEDIENYLYPKDEESKNE